MNTYNVIGVMSGTSLDGLDLAFCRFTYENEKWTYKIIKASTKEYTEDWIECLTSATKLSAYDFIKLHKEYGRFIGTSINIFLKNCNDKPDFIASHGHTTFHQPEKHINFQVGDGAMIASETGLTTISDFRTMDIALGGQGAPLVPVGDMHLFGEYDFCINLGGFANVSFKAGNKRIAFDICPCNIKINELMRTINHEYDKNGELGRTGKTDEVMLKELNALNYYKLMPPKSLGKEWLDEYYAPIIDKSGLRLEDKISTIYEHTAMQIAKATYSASKRSVLFTGGGTYNKYLIERIKAHTKNDIIIPDDSLINYKEALIFAFLGTLRYRRETNCLASVTGSKIDNVSGAINYIKWD